MNFIQNLKQGSGVFNWRLLISLPLLIIIFVFIYAFMTLLGGIIPVNIRRSIPVEGERIYLINNGYHIALALPRDSCPYGDIFDIPLNLSGGGGFFYFGWGDRQFYLGTPTVNNIDLTLAIKALFSPSSAVLEVLYIHTLSSDKPGVSSFLVTKDELSDLYKYIKESFMNSKKSSKQIASNEIDQAFLGSIFFEARGSYSLFNTCNNWTSKGLKKAGLNTHLWTPFTWGVE